ncbi:YdbL family protein [Methylophilus rhizosphaerae]|uniref:YdbL family protein n=1 Tax=Methylophilus rhizosphaerae TaxID=492660 RepID=UPI000A7C28FF|nr:YdbL family protein [Methylophilus rhizosphaerae]
MSMLLKFIDRRHNVLQLFLHAAYHIIKALLLAVCAAGLVSLPAQAAADLDVNTPAVAAVKASMQSRHQQLLPYYQSGAVGLTADGFIAVKEAGLVPLSQRSAFTALVKDENADRAKLYQGMAAANGHPEWEGEIQRTFAQRWVDKAQSGWFVQRDGQWIRK